MQNHHHHPISSNNKRRRRPSGDDDQQQRRRYSHNGSSGGSRSSNNNNNLRSTTMEQDAAPNKRQRREQQRPVYERKNSSSSSHGPASSNRNERGGRDNRRRDSYPRNNNNNRHYSNNGGDRGRRLSSSEWHHQQQRQHPQQYYPRSSYQNSPEQQQRRRHSLSSVAADRSPPRRGGGSERRASWMGGNNVQQQHRSYHHRQQQGRTTNSIQQRFQPPSNSASTKKASVRGPEVVATAGDVVHQGTGTSPGGAGGTSVKLNKNWKHEGTSEKQDSLLKTNNTAKEKSIASKSDPSSVCLSAKERSQVETTDPTEASTTATATDTAAIVAVHCTANHHHHVALKSPPPSPPPAAVVVTLNSNDHNSSSSLTTSPPLLTSPHSAETRIPRKKYCRDHFVGVDGVDQKSNDSALSDKNSGILESIPKANDSLSSFIHTDSEKEERNVSSGTTKKTASSPSLNSRSKNRKARYCSDDDSDREELTTSARKIKSGATSKSSGEKTKKDRSLFNTDSDEDEAPKKRRRRKKRKKEPVIEDCQDPSLVTVGSRVEVYWDGEDEYFAGKVMKYVPVKQKKPFFVKYDDGDKEWMSFEGERFRLLSSPPARQAETVVDDDKRNGLSRRDSNKQLPRRESMASSSNSCSRLKKREEASPSKVYLMPSVPRKQKILCPAAQRLETGSSKVAPHKDRKFVGQRPKEITVTNEPEKGLQTERGDNIAGVAEHPNQQKRTLTDEMTATKPTGELTVKTKTSGVDSVSAKQKDTPNIQRTTSGETTTTNSVKELQGTAPVDSHEKPTTKDTATKTSVSDKNSSAEKIAKGSVRQLKTDNGNTHDEQSEDSSPAVHPNESSFASEVPVIPVKKTDTTGPDENPAATVSFAAGGPDDESSSSDSETDEEELRQWAIKMFGVNLPPVTRPKEIVKKQPLDAGSDSATVPAGEPKEYFGGPVPMSISEKVKLGRRRSNSEISYALPPLIRKKSAVVAAHVVKRKKSLSAEEKAEKEAAKERETKRKKEEARPLTSAEISAILGEDAGCPSPIASTWVRRSMRQPSKSALCSPHVKALVDRLRSNDSDMVVLKMKKYCPDPATPQIVIDAVLDALEENTNCEALYIQNFNEGMRDEQVMHLVRILQRPACKIWCLNIGETYKVKTRTWEKFAKCLKHTKITHMYASEHTITTELKDQIRDTIRANREKHNMHIDPNNLDTIIQCTHCWWNPVNAKVLRPYLKTKGYEHILSNAEAQGLQGTVSGATFT